MCGIAGIIGRIDDANAEAAARMSKALRHRGPDADGLWTSQPDASGEGCFLAHRRLSILDLSPCGNQPMVDPVTGNVIVFNGEIYNFADIRNDLVASGHSFESTGDTAVLLRALGQWDPFDAVRGLRGMFAFALFDPTRRRLTLARDPLGIKPLYYCINPDSAAGWTLCFASEVRAILAGGLIKNPRLDPAAVCSVVCNGFVMGPGTAVQSVQSLPPGVIVEFDEAGRELRREQFWTFPPPRLQPAETAEREVAEAVENSVKLHLTSDVPVAVFLSGGIDSSVIANLAQRNLSEPLNTFTLTFEEAGFDEGPYAAQVARALGTRHTEVMLTESRFLSEIDRAIASLDQPTFDGLNSFFISQAVRQSGISVALTGTGGDELFGGYTSFNRLPRLLKFSNAGGAMGRRATKFASWLTSAMSGGASKGRIGSQGGWAKLPEMILSSPDLIRMYQLAYALFLPGFQRELLGEACSAIDLQDGMPAAFRERLEEETSHRSRLAAVSVLEQRIFMGERLLRDTDAASMAVSLETRLPFVDQDVSATLERVPDSIRFEPLGTKSLLKKVGLKGLDPRIWDRPKSGFVLPFDRWIRRGMHDTLAKVLLDATAVSAVGLNPAGVARLWYAFIGRREKIYWSRLWAIYTLIRWCQLQNIYI